MPALYTLELTLSSGQKITQKIGVRQVTIVDGVLQLNGRPIKLRGVDHHDSPGPITGRATDGGENRAATFEYMQAPPTATSSAPPTTRPTRACSGVRRPRQSRHG